MAKRCVSEAADRAEATSKLKASTATDEKGVRRIVYSLELAKLVCERMMERDELGLPQSLAKICEAPDMPAESTVYKWLNDHPEFVEHYTRAREAITEMNVNDIVTIADTEPQPDRARVRIEARKWYAGRMNPKKYGEKVTVDHNHKRDLADMSDGDLEHIARGGSGRAAAPSNGTAKPDRIH